MQVTIEKVAQLLGLKEIELMVERERNAALAETVAKLQGADPKPSPLSTQG